MTGIVALQTSRSALMTFHQNATIRILQSATPTRAVTTTNAIWTYRRVIRAAIPAAPAESNRAALWARTDIQSAHQATIVAQHLATTIAIGTARASLVTWWIHQLKRASASARVLLAPVHGHLRRLIRASVWTQLKFGLQSPKKASPVLGADWRTIATTDSPATTESRSFQHHSILTHRCAPLSSVEATQTSSQVPVDFQPTDTTPVDSRLSRRFFLFSVHHSWITNSSLIILNLLIFHETLWRWIKEKDLCLEWKYICCAKLWIIVENESRVYFRRFHFPLIACITQPEHFELIRKFKDDFGLTRRLIIQPSAEACPASRRWCPSH